MSAVPCWHCGQPVVIRVLRSGTSKPFDNKLSAPDVVAEACRYVPVRSEHGLVMVPASDLSTRRLEGIRWFATLHECVQGLRIWQDKRDTSRLGEIQQEIAAVLGIDLTSAHTR